MPDPTGRVSHVPEMHRGVSWKQPARVATTANITLSGTQTIDGITVVAGDRVLVKDQTAGAENGIYDCSASTWARSFDFDQDTGDTVPAEEVLGALVYVIAGTANGGKVFKNTNTSAPTLGSTALTFTEFGDTSGDFVTKADGGSETVSTVAATGSTETIDLADGNWHDVTLDDDCTFTFTGATNGEGDSFVLILRQDGTGGHAVTWPGSVVWPDGSAPTLDTDASSVQILTFLTRDGGTTWFGFLAGSGGSDLTIEDEGSALSTAATTLDFVGAGVTASGTGAEKTITIPGATASDVAALGFVGPILISDTPSSPLVFADLIQNDDGTDLVYADL